MIVFLFSFYYFAGILETIIIFLEPFFTSCGSHSFRSERDESRTRPEKKWQQREREEKIIINAIEKCLQPKSLVEQLSSLFPSARRFMKKVYGATSLLFWPSRLSHKCRGSSERSESDLFQVTSIRLGHVSLRLGRLSQGPLR